MLNVLTAIARARKSGLIRLRKADKKVRLHCIGGECGLCCKVMGGDVVVTPEDASVIPSSVTERFGDVIVLKSLSGSCSQLVQNKCDCYEVRPSGCREYPWYSIDDQLYYDTGCPGMLYDRDERPEKETISPIETYLPLPGFLQKFFIILFRIW